MNEKIFRTFLAIPLPREIRSKKNMLYSTLENSPASINWVKDIQLHLTVKFLGNTPESEFSRIIKTIENITQDSRPFHILIKNTGCFPIKNRPRTLWMGVEGNLSPLFDLVMKIEKKLENLGFPKINQEFIPHITVAKIKYPQKYTPDISEFLNSSYDPIDFTVDRVQFLSSELLPSGTLYTLLGSFPLGETL